MTLSDQDHLSESSPIISSWRQVEVCVHNTTSVGGSGPGILSDGSRNHAANCAHGEHSGSAVHMYTTAQTTAGIHSIIKSLCEGQQIDLRIWRKIPCVLLSGTRNPVSFPSPSEDGGIYVNEESPISGCESLLLESCIGFCNSSNLLDFNSEDITDEIDGGGSPEANSESSRNAMLVSEPEVTETNNNPPSAVRKRHENLATPNRRQSNPIAPYSSTYEIICVPRHAKHASTSAIEQSTPRSM